MSSNSKAKLFPMGRRFTAASGTLERELGGRLKCGGGERVVGGEGGGEERVMGGKGGEVQLDFLEWALLV